MTTSAPVPEPEEVARRIAAASGVRALFPVEPRAVRIRVVGERPDAEVLIADGGRRVVARIATAGEVPVAAVVDGIVDGLGSGGAPPPFALDLEIAYIE